MKKETKVLIILGIIAILLTGALIINYMGKKVPDNDISVVGNSAGNVNNGGLFAQNNTKVYFSNSFDRGYLYEMNADETDIKLISASPVRNILIGGDYLYYYMDTSEANGTGLGYVVRNYGIFRSKLNGKNVKCLDRQASVSMQLIGNYLYYQRYNNKDFTKIYRVKTSNTEPEFITDEIINPACAYNGTIYYNGTNKDHFLYALNTNNNQPYTVYEGNLWFPQYANGYIYYMDVSSDYRLCRYDLNGQMVEILTNDRVESFNVGSYNIYYQKNNDEHALMRMNLDGSNPEIVALGDYNDINLTSQYAYFKQFGDDVTTYHTPVYGTVNVTVFNNALEAVK